MKIKERIDFETIYFRNEWKRNVEKDSIHYNFIHVTSMKLLTFFVKLYQIRASAGWASVTLISHVEQPFEVC